MALRKKIAKQLFEFANELNYLLWEERADYLCSLFAEWLRERRLKGIATGRVADWHLLDEAADELEGK